MSIRSAWITCIIALTLVAPPARAAMGDLRATVPVTALNITFSPTQLIAYVSVEGTNNVAAVDLTTFTVAATATVGTKPWGVTISPDGSRLYTANSGEKSTSVVDTSSMTEISRITTPFAPIDVAATASKLYLSPYHSGSTTFGMQVNLQTSAVTTFDARGAGHDAALEMSPDGQSLFMGSRFLSPVGLRRFDVSGATPQFVTAGSILWGSNGRDVTVSHDGEFVLFSCGSGNDQIYQTAKASGSNLEVLGEFNVGNYPNSAAFALDDSVVFMDMRGLVKVFDVESTALLSSFRVASTSEIITEMRLDPTGRNLLVAVGGELRVFEVPEPTLALQTLLAGLALGSRRSRVRRVIGK